MSSNIESQNAMYHSPERVGFWTDKDVFSRNIQLKNKSILQDVVPIGIKEADGTLVMVLSTLEGKVTQPAADFLGLEVVRGNSSEHPYESDGEPLIQIHYLKVDKIERNPRRIRPTAINFGIYGDTVEPSAERGSHRALGESADFYLEGHDTQYAPGESGHDDIRRFPFWRIGVWGEQTELTKEFLPTPQEAQKD